MKDKSASKKGKPKPNEAFSPNSINQQTEESLREYQAILAMAEEVAQIGSWKWDLRTQKVTWSDEMFRLFGVEREGFDGDVNRVVAERVHPEDAAAVAESNRRVLEEAQPVPMSYRIVLPDGTERTLWAQGKLIRDEAGQPQALSGFVQDITERVRAEKKVYQMKRLYATLSQVNQMIVRVKEQNELFQTICDVAVQYGEFSLAWVGLLDEDTDDIRPVAANGVDVAHWPFPILNIQKGEHQNSLTPIAIQTSKVVTSENIFTDQRTQYFSKNYKNYNYHAAAAIPFRLRDKTIGALVLISHDEGLFKDPDETRLLDEMGLDISFALDMLESEMERRQAEAALRLSEENFSKAFRSSPAALLVTRLADGTFTEVNEAYCAIVGYEQDELIGHKTTEFNIFIDPGDRQKIIDTLMAAGSIRDFETNIRHRSGEIRSVLAAQELITLNGEPCIITHLLDITRRKLDEQTLRESEERLRLSLLAANQGSYDLNVQTGDAIVNRQYAEMLGYDFETFVETNAFWIERLHPDDQEITAKAYSDYINGLLPEYRVEFRQRMKDGNWKWILSLGKVVEYDAQGKPLRMLGTHTDITERKKVEEALKQSESVLRLFVEHSPASIAMFDREMRYIVASHRYLIDYRLPIQDITGHSHYDIFPEIPERWKEIHRRCLAGAIEKADEDPFPREDGTMDWVRWEIRPWYEEPGVIGGIILFSEVITERKQAEESIRNRNRTLLTLHKVALQIGSELRLPQLLANTLGEAQSLLDADRGGGVYLYEPQSQLLRLAHGTGINQGRDGITVQIGEGVAGHVYQTAQPLIIDDYTHWEGRATILVNDPPSTVMGVPLFVQGKVIGVLTFIANSSIRKFNTLDVQQAEMFAAQVAIAIQNAQLYQNAQDEIAERTKTQEELRLLNLELEQHVTERTAELYRANTELEQANRAKDEFLANMSHELRTPLNTVLGLSETLLEQRRGPLNERQSQALELISSSGRHLLGLINDILEVSKIEAGKLQLYSTTVSVKELCESSLNFVKEMALKKKIEIEYLNEEDITELNADPQRLKQILINLLMNAVKFTPDQGKVSLKVFTNIEKEQIRFSVTDTGIGIAQEDLKKLFTPFTQLDGGLARQYEGTGLGLALVQKLTDLHGGSVQVESDPGKGSCFTICLPWRSETGPTKSSALTVEHPEDEEQADRSAVETYNHEVILLAEDNEANILTMGEYLEAYGYEVVIAHDGFEAVEKVKSTNPGLILMDIQMPAMDGLEAIRLLRSDSRFTTTPIIALTALAMPGDRERCLSAGADEYMSKPVRLRELVKTVSTMLEEKKK